jgi:tetratricopeptide (TPR) repeat protein
MKQVAEAKTHLTAGLAAFKRGDYDLAEQECKEAMTLYPFLAQANLTVGKILLIRGAAAKDYALIDSARLMFEMAKALDPALREAEVLLELFRPAGIE